MDYSSAPPARSTEVSAPLLLKYLGVGAHPPLPAPPLPPPLWAEACSEIHRSNRGLPKLADSQALGEEVPFFPLVTFFPPSVYYLLYKWADSNTKCVYAFIQSAQPLLSELVLLLNPTYSQQSTHFPHKHSLPLFSIPFTNLYSSLYFVHKHNSILFFPRFSEQPLQHTGAPTDTHNHHNLTTHILYSMCALIEIGYGFHGFKRCALQ